MAVACAAGPCPRDGSRCVDKKDVDCKDDGSPCPAYDCVKDTDKCANVKCTKGTKCSDGVCTKPMCQIGTSKRGEGNNWCNTCQCVNAGQIGALWQCTQMPGEAIYIPGHFKQAVINLDEAVAAAVQANDVNPTESWLASFEGKVDIGALVEQAEAALGEDNTVLHIRGPPDGAWVMPP